MFQMNDEGEGFFGSNVSDEHFFNGFFVQGPGPGSGAQRQVIAVTEGPVRSPPVENGV